MNLVRVLSILAMIAVAVWFIFGNWRIAPQQLRVDINRNTVAIAALYARVDSLEAVQRDGMWR